MEDTKIVREAVKDILKKQNLRYERIYTEDRKYGKRMKFYGMAHNAAQKEAVVREVEALGVSAEMVAVPTTGHGRFIMHSLVVRIKK